MKEKGIRDRMDLPFRNQQLRVPLSFDAIVELTNEQMVLWGTCPICCSPPGAPCKAISGEARFHLERLGAAPTKVRLVDVSGER